MALISLSRRTDIPAFYGDWLIRRLRAGYCLVKHPFRADWIRRVDLGPEAVDGLVFWTRYPEPFLGHLDEIERLGLPYYFQMTLNAMDRLLEPRLPPPEALLSSFESLSLRVGPERLIWRFDPILVSSVTPPEEIAGRFEGLCARLAGRCRRVVVSLAQLYAKTTRRLSKIQDLTVTDLNADESAGLAEDLLGRLAETARGHGLEVRICACSRDYSHLGVYPSKCIDETIINEGYGLDLALTKARGQRPDCRCAESIDIGAYNSCPHGCLYCYATSSQERAQRFFDRHDKESELLAG